MAKRLRNMNGAVVTKTYDQDESYRNVELEEKLELAHRMNQYSLERGKKLFEDNNSLREDLRNLCQKNLVCLKEMEGWKTECNHLRSEIEGLRDHIAHLETYINRIHGGINDFRN